MLVQPFMRFLKTDCLMLLKRAAVTQQPGFGNYTREPTMVLTVRSYDEANIHVDYGRLCLQFALRTRLATKVTITGTNRRLRKAWSVR